MERSFPPITATTTMIRFACFSLSFDDHHQSFNDDCCSKHIVSSFPSSCILSDTTGRTAVLDIFCNAAQVLPGSPPPPVLRTMINKYKFFRAPIRSSVSPPNTTFYVNNPPTAVAAHKTTTKQLLHYCYQEMDLPTSAEEELGAPPPLLPHR